jgi:hypothetical protein
MGQMKEMKMDHSKMEGMKMDNSKMSEWIWVNQKMPWKGQYGRMDLFSEYNYDFWNLQKKTNMTKMFREVLLNLTGNMNRYIWSMNGVPLSEADKIKISSEEVTRTLRLILLWCTIQCIYTVISLELSIKRRFVKTTQLVCRQCKVTIEFYGIMEMNPATFFIVTFFIIYGKSSVIWYAEGPANERVSSF